jgi:hypothetical protein
VRTRRWRSRGVTVVAICAAGASLLPGGARAQQKAASLAVGVPVTVLPLQTAWPTPSGAWPGGANSLQALVDAFDSEVDFALSEQRATTSWKGPGAVVSMVQRNPLLKVDPERLAYEGLDGKEDKKFKDPIYEPLHGQLRSLSALLDTRVVALPLRLVYVPADSVAPGEHQVAGAQPDSAPADGHAQVRIALIDTRSGQVLWRGWIAGPPAEADSPGLLAGLAGQLVGWLSP